MSSGDVVVQRHDSVLRRANDYSDGNKVTKFRTYISINPNGTIHPMYIRNAVSVPDRDRLWATRLRLSSHRLAIETGRWSRIPRDNRLCSCGAIQTEEHVICFCLLSQSIRSQFDTVEFTNIVKFFNCANTDLVCRICSLNNDPL